MYKMDIGGYMAYLAGVPYVGYLITARGLDKATDETFDLEISDTGVYDALDFGLHIGLGGEIGRFGAEIFWAPGRANIEPARSPNSFKRQNNVISLAGFIWRTRGFWRVDSEQLQPRFVFDVLGLYVGRRLFSWAR